jgi:lipoate-protein ligase A
MQTKIFFSDTVDCWFNLALEEYYLEELDREEQEQCIFYLWQNRKTVVIGRHQNAWRECRHRLLEQEGGKLARRISGGGAVYHDLGNLNFSFLVSRRLFDVHRQLEVILAALRKLGIQAVFSGRNDLTAGGRKFSGNAFCYRQRAALHHGTLLVSADMGAMTRYLSVSTEKMRSKGVDSLTARVVNLAELQPGLSVPELKTALQESFQRIYGGEAAMVKRWQKLNSLPRWQELFTRQSSWAWRLGRSPRFDVDLTTRFDWGAIELGLRLSRGRIRSASVYSDAMDEAFIDVLPEVLEGCEFASRDMAAALSALPVTPDQEKLVRDLVGWLARQDL